MYSLFERFQGGLLGMTIAQGLVSHLPNSGCEPDLTIIPQIMMGHVTASELLSHLSAGTFSSMDWSFYGTLSLAIAGELKPTAQDYASWSQNKIPLNEEILTWVNRQSRSSLVTVTDSLQSQSLTPKDQAIALALYGAINLPGDWQLAMDRIIPISPAPDCTAPLLGCLLGVQGTIRTIPVALRQQYTTATIQIALQAKLMVRSWSGSQVVQSVGQSVGDSVGAIVTSPRRIHLT